MVHLGAQRAHLQLRDLWRALHEAGAEVVPSAHEHFYERFVPQDAGGRPDGARGIRQFVAGTGGAFLYQPSTIAANSEVRVTAYDVLKFTLAPGRFRWEFVPVSGPGDVGSG